MDFDIIDDARSSKSCSTRRAIGEPFMRAVPWILCNGAAILVYRFVRLVAAGIGAGGVNHALSVKLKLFGSCFGIDWKVAEEFFSLRRNIIL